MFLVVVGAILISIGTIVYYQYSLKRYQRRLYESSHGGPRTGGHEDILSLDEDDHGHREFEQPPTTAPIIAAIGVTLLVVLYWLFLHEATEANIDDTYDTLALRHLGEVLTRNPDFADEQTPVLIIVEPDIYRDLLSAEAQREQAEGAAKEKIQDPQQLIALREVLTRGNNFTIVATRPTVPLLSARAKPGGDWTLRGQELQAILSDFDTIKVVICLGNYQPATGRDLQGRRDRNYYLAVFHTQSLLYEYLRLVESGEVDLAFISKGTYDKRAQVPDNVDLDRLVDKHFLRIVPTNVKHVRSRFRQYIGPDPYDPDAF